MARSTRLLFSLALTAALAVPTLADAQAIPRPAGGSSSGGSSGGSSGSSGGSSGSSSSSGGSGGSTAPRAGSTDSGSRAPSRRAPSDASRRGSAVSRGSDRPAPAPGGVVGSQSSSSRTDAVRSADQAAGRARNDRPVTGFAEVRPASDVRFISFPLFGPWGRSYPWYGAGFGWNYSFLGYNPWRYGATRWGFGRYGLWYDPYSYYPYYGGCYGGRSGYDEDEREERRVGSIRLKADPKNAKVYIDGALVGVVDDFDGLTDHLEVEAGAHQLELRADGFETYVVDLTVEAGKTRTHRIKLTRVK
jgi:hypothetical protein